MRKQRVLQREKQVARSLALFRVARHRLNVQAQRHPTGGRGLQDSRQRTVHERDALLDGQPRSGLDFLHGSPLGGSVLQDFLFHASGDRDAEPVHEFHGLPAAYRREREENLLGRNSLVFAQVAVRVHQAHSGCGVKDRLRNEPLRAQVHFTGNVQVLVALGRVPLRNGHAAEVHVCTRKALHPFGRVGQAGAFRRTVPRGGCTYQIQSAVAVLEAARAQPFVEGSH